jgi:hypothetical protein
MCTTATKINNPQGKRLSILMKCWKSEIDGVVFTEKRVH